MPQIFTFNPRSALNNFGKWIVWVLICVSGEGTQGLEFADSVEPSTYGCAVLRPPLFDRESELRPPQKQWGADCCKCWIQPRIQPFDHQNELPDLFRWRAALRIQGRSKLDQLLRLPLLLLESREK